MFNRRQFLKSSSLVAMAPSIPAFLQQTARAIEPEKDQRILVVLQLSGGNDGLNTVVPFSDDLYARHRKVLRLPADRLHRISDDIGLHPAMRAAADLFEDNRLAIVQGVGYPNPNRSHDVSMAIWQTARFDREEHNGYGWIGRALDALPAPGRNAPGSVLIGGDAAPVVLRGRKSISSTFTSIDDMLADQSLRPGQQTRSGTDDLRSFIGRTALDAYTTADLLRGLADTATTSVSYPASQLGGRLQLISQLIQADLGTRVYYAVHGGYDTHALQIPSHSALLQALSQALKAFLDDMAAAGLDDRVLVLCFSEFGRQVRENASAGTDHGTAGPVLLAGSRVRGGLHGRQPDLSVLDNNAPGYTLDFRRVYATLLKEWLRVDPGTALNEKFDGLEVLS